MVQHILKYTTYRRKEQDKTRTIMHAQPISQQYMTTIKPGVLEMYVALGARISNEHERSNNHNHNSLFPLQ